MTILPDSTHPATLAILLDSLADQQPSPKAPKWEREATRGFARSWVECPKCHGSGQAAWKGRTVNCDHQHCHGQGGWAGDPMATSAAFGPVEVNGHRSQTVEEFYRLATTMTLPELERLDQAIDSLNGDLERQARELHPCWQQLHNALTGMALAAPSHHRALVWTHLDHLPLGPLMTCLYDDALLILGDALGREFRAPHWSRVKADENLKTARMAKSNGRHGDRNGKPERDIEIRRLHGLNWSNRAIGRRLDLSEKTVRRVLACGPSPDGATLAESAG